MKTSEKPPKHDEGSDRHVPLVPWSPKKVKVPLAFKPLGKGGIGDRHAGLSQDYVLQPAIGRQSKWRNRAALVPRLDLSAYRVKAVIDWIDVRVKSSCKIWAGNISSQLGAAIGEKLWAEPTGNKEGSFSREFDIRMQDPTPARLYRLMKAIDEARSLSTDQEITAIEISVDWYPTSKSEGDRLLMADLLWRHLLPPEEVWRMDRGWPRSLIGGGRGTNLGSENTNRLLDKPKPRMIAEPLIYAGVELLPDPEAARNLSPRFHLQPASDGTTCFGREMGDVHIRVMHKTMNQQDRQTGARVDLDESECRARIEVTLRGQALQMLTLRNLRDLPAIKFETLASKYFRFRLPTVSCHDGAVFTAHDLALALRGRRELEIFWTTGVLGLDQYQQALGDVRRQVRNRLPKRRGPRTVRDRSGLGKRGLSKACTDLYDRVYDALRRLHWGKA